jgi:hypothetical protein
MVAWGTLGLTAWTSSTLIGLLLSGCAGLALVTAIGGFVAAVVVRPRSAGNQADRRRLEGDLEDGRATRLRVTATHVVFARDLRDPDEGPWYLFDVGGDRALWLSGPRFSGKAAFPSAAFELTLTTGSELVLDVIGSDAPLPLAEERSATDVASEYQDVAFEIIDGPFSDAVARVFGERS